MKWLKRIAVVAVLVLAGWWVRERFFISDETRIKRALDAMVKAVETGNMVGLSDGIAADYTDDRDLDRGTLVAMVHSYRLQQQAIFIFLTEMKVEVEADHHTAQVGLIANILIKPKGGADTHMDGERFRLYFRKDDRSWKLTRAESPKLKFD